MHFFIRPYLTEYAIACLKVIIIWPDYLLHELGITQKTDPYSKYPI